MAQVVVCQCGCGCVSKTRSVSRVCAPCRFGNHSRAGKVETASVEGERGRESNRQEAAAWRWALVEIAHMRPYDKTEGFICEDAERMQDIAKAAIEKRGDSRNSGDDVPEPTTKEDAPTQEPATTETPTSTPATPSTQETVLVERLKELVTVWRGQSEEGHNYRMVSTVYRDVADELEETLRATTHPEKTKDGN